MHPSRLGVNFLQHKMGQNHHFQASKISFHSRYISIIADFLFIVIKANLKTRKRACDMDSE